MRYWGTQFPAPRLSDREMYSTRAFLSIVQTALNLPFLYVVLFLITFNFTSY